MKTWAVVLVSLLAIAVPAGAQRFMKPVPHGNPGEWFSPDTYPPEAIRAQRQGRVVVVLGIDSAGAVATCTVRESSGTAALDEGTCVVAREHGRFDPATDRKGRPTAGDYVMPVRWQLPDTPPEAVDVATLPPHRMQARELFFNVAGVLTSCRVIENEPADGKSDPGSLCPPTMIGQQQVPMTRGGKPVPYKVVTRVATDVTAIEP